MLNMAIIILILLGILYIFKKYYFDVKKQYKKYAIFFKV